MQTTQAIQAAPPPQTVPMDICVKMVDAAAQNCVIPEQTVTAAPNWDAMATSLASLSNAFAWGSLIIAVLAFFAALAWGRIVTERAEREAKAMAKACADEYIKAWLADEAPKVIRERIDFLLDATTGDGDDAKAADEMGREAG